MTDSGETLSAQLDRLAGSLRGGLPTKSDLIEIARIGPDAIELAPLVLSHFLNCREQTIRAVCLCVLMKVLVSSPHEIAKQVADALTPRLTQPAYRRQRTRILLTLLHIGRQARGALPTLLTLQGSFKPGRFRLTLRSAFYCILSECLASGDAEEQSLALRVIPRAGSLYLRISLLEGFLRNPTGTPETIAAARTLWKTLKDREQRIEATGDLTLSAQMARLTEILRSRIATKVDLIDIANIGPRAIELAPLVLSCFLDRQSEEIRSVCLSVLMKVLRDSSHENAKLVADALTPLLNDPAFQAQRSRILLLFACIGRQARGALPTMVALRRVVQTGRVQSRLTAAFGRILSGCLASGEADEQMLALEIIPRAGLRQGIFLLSRFLVNPSGAPETIAAARTLLKVMEEREQQVLSGQRPDEGP